MKKYYKVIAAYILAMTVAMGMFTGCGKNKPTEKPAPQDSEIVQETGSAEEQQQEDLVYYGEEYTAPEDVAAYIYEWEELPPNFITKSEAQKLGWDSSKGNLWDVAYGKSIGGDRFGNREGLLPEGEEYRECDVNYAGGYRDAERLVYSIDDYDIYYTDDHYESFSQVYSYEEGYVWEE